MELRHPEPRLPAADRRAASHAHERGERERDGELQAAVIDDRLHVRALVKISDFGSGSLGPLAAMLGDREPVEFGGDDGKQIAGFAERVFPRHPMAAIFKITARDVVAV